MKSDYLAYGISGSGSGSDSDRNSTSLTLAPMKDAGSRNGGKQGNGKTSSPSPSSSTAHNEHSAAMQKQDTLLLLDPKDLFIRTTSNTDIFTTLGDQGGCTSSLSPVDWTKMGESELGMNSQSHTTLIADNGAAGNFGGQQDHYQNFQHYQGYHHHHQQQQPQDSWPFTFDNSGPFLGHHEHHGGVSGSVGNAMVGSSHVNNDIMSGGAISPSQLDNSSYQGSSADLLPAMNPNFDNGAYQMFPPMQTSYSHLEQQLLGNDSVMDAINALGSNTFSTSFVERMMEQVQYPPDLLAHDGGLPPPYPYHDHHYAAPWLHDQSSEPFWASSPITDLQHNLLPPQEPTSSSKHSSKKSKGGASKKSKSKNNAETVKTPSAAAPTAIACGFASAAETNSNRRRTTQGSIICNQCQTEVGVVFIRGAYVSTSPQPVDLTCDKCNKDSSLWHNESSTVGFNDPANLSESVGASSSVTADKKRRRRQTKVVDCEVCHCEIGHGGLAPHTSTGDIKIEYICNGCSDKYMFCSECGGGGKQRTGKWRPKELFEQGRRTCSLPHIRVGTADVHYKVMPVQDLTSEVLQGIQDVFFDCLLSLYCVPSVMTGDKYSTFDSIKAEIEKLWLTSVLDVLTNNVLQGQKYITVAWIQKRHRNKGVGKSNQGKEVVPWLQRLGLSGIVSPPKSANPEEDNQCYVAFSIAEWDAANQSIFLAQMAPRSVFLKTMEGYMDLIRNCVQTIQRDALALSQAKPVHIWCWAKADHIRLQSIPTRLKFDAKADYLNSHPKVDRSIFERADYAPLQEEGTFVYASQVKPFCAKTITGGAALVPAPVPVVMAGNVAPSSNELLEFYTSNP